MSEQLLEEMSERYRRGETPWDQQLPPPEIVALAAELTPGRALDLGCGPGRSCIYLARHGWQCDGVDFVPQAIETAQQRAKQAGVAEQARFYCASVAELPPLAPPYDLAIDIGCLHAQRGADLVRYADGLAARLRSGAVYVLFARLADTPDSGHGLPETTIMNIFAGRFMLVKIERGTSIFKGTAAASAWFWFTRTDAA